VDAWWEEAAGNIAQSMPTVQIGEPSATVIGGEGALIGAIEASQEDIYGFMALVIHEEKGYIFLALVSPQDDWAGSEDAFILMLSSVEFLD
jgi:hypothetical protein